jgi:hypothetical protein
MEEKVYVCGYNHCQIKEKIPASEAVVVGKRRYHKECAEIHSKIEDIKRIYFDYIDNNSDYVQVVGVINNLIFAKFYSVDFIEFAVKYTVIYGGKIKSPYALHKIVKNGIVERKYNDENLRKGVEIRFDNRTGINSSSKGETRR